MTTIVTTPVEPSRLVRLARAWGEAIAQRELAFASWEACPLEDRRRRDFLYRVYRANVVHARDLEKAVAAARNAEVWTSSNQGGCRNE